jgi:fumarylacetoacetate (FAA) hydrolase family protein
MAELRDALRPALPEDAANAALAGRVWRPDVGGPSVVVPRGAELLDITKAFPTMRDVCEAPDPAAAMRGAPGLGRLVNQMMPTDRCEPWVFGVAALMRNLARQGVLSD